MEWTLDHDRLSENPLMSAAGQVEIGELSRRHRMTIPSVTGDCFMQAPFWKACGDASEALKSEFVAVAEACAATGISTIVIPLVDNGRLEDAEQETALVGFLECQAPWLATQGLRVSFECNFGADETGRFISRFDPVRFGINYDIGNSAAMGFNPAEEIAAYGHRVINVHVKDRILGGTTVPLGTGSADFDAAFASLIKAGYAGNYILQTARAEDGDHAGALVRYRDMTIDWLNQNAA